MAGRYPWAVPVPRPASVPPLPLPALRGHLPAAPRPVPAVPGPVPAAAASLPAADLLCHSSASSDSTDKDRAWRQQLNK